MRTLRPFEDELAGVTFVGASAGTGKTYAIEMLYLRLLVEAGLRTDQIVVVTYTNAAAAELRKRVRGRLQEAVAWLDGDAAPTQDWHDFLARQRADGAARRALLAAVYGFDQASISTIHGFCQSVLQEHAFDSGASFGVEMIADQAALVDEVVRDFVAAELFEASPDDLEQVWGHGAFTAMARFAALVAGQPDVVVCPEPGNPEAELREWREVFDRARRVWEAESQELIPLRAAHPSLKKAGHLDPGEMEEGLNAAFSVPEPAATRRYAGLAKLGDGFLARQTRKHHEPPTHEFFTLCGALADIEERMRSGYRVGYYCRLAEYARREVPRRKAEAGVLYFDDLLLGLHAALEGPGGEALTEKLRARFKAGLIDEFQDTDPVQYEIFRRVFADRESSLILVGDPKQSIYSFRGADVHTYVAAGAGADRASTLDTNRRSGARAVAAVNSLFVEPDVFVLEAIRFETVASTGKIPEIDLPGSAGVSFLWCDPPEAGEGVEDYRRAIRRGVASRIVELLNSDATIAESAIRPRDIAVLCRTNAEAADLQAELRRRGVPTVLTGDRSVFETPEASEMARVLAALADPRDATAIRSALCTPLCGVGGDELVTLRDDEAGWQGWMDRFHRLRAAWDEHGFMAAFRGLQEECDSAARLLSQRGGERKLTNYLHVAELLQVASRELRNGPQGLVDWLARMSSDSQWRGEMAPESAQVRLESDADAVILTTIHKSKGLEYPVVFLPYLWNKPRPVDKTLTVFRAGDERRGIWVGAEAPSEVRASAATLRDGEDMRLAYVALTRARQSTFVVVPAYAKASGSALQRLLGEMSRDRVEQLAAGSGGAITVEDLSASHERFRPSSTIGALVEPIVPRAVVGDWRVSSFSGLTSRSDALSPQDEEGLDLDEVGPVAGGESGTGPDVVLADLDTGTRVGLMIHSIFEDLDFRLHDQDAMRELVARKTASFRAGTAYVDALCRSIAQVLTTPLNGAEGVFSLADVTRSQRLDELEFILPVCGPSGSRLTPGRLAQVLRSHGAPSPAPEYAARVEGLGFAGFAGFLRGYIDLVFEHGGCWYVVDYKSNFLGRSSRDYQPSRLLLPMHHHDYFLQYLLYVVATDRYLSHRVPGYSYESHFGGVFYFFLRGMDGSDSQAGVFRDRPRSGLVKDLSELFAHGAPDE